MKKIKYRIWIKKSKEMIYLASYYLDCYYMQLTNDGWGVFDRHSEKNVSVARSKDNDVLMQSTNKIDVNGREIYECDVVKDCQGRVFIVSYSEHVLRWQIKAVNEQAKKCSRSLQIPIFDWTYPEMTLEVIGNIHENPELVEG